MPTFVISSTSLADMERHIVDRAHAEVAGVTAKDVAVRIWVMDLPGAASFGKAVAEVLVSAQKSSHRELIETR